MDENGKESHSKAVFTLFKPLHKYSKEMRNAHKSMVTVIDNQMLGYILFPWELFVDGMCVLDCLVSIVVIVLVLVVSWTPPPTPPPH